jgi:hypothetical protein
MTLFFRTFCFILFGSSISVAKPFWTEKSNFIEGDRVFFVGIATNQKSVEIGRKTALQNASNELSNYLQSASTDGLTFHTQMTFEEKSKGGAYDVYRLMFVEQAEVSKFKSKLAEKEAKAEERKVESLNKIIDQKQTLIKKAEAQEAKLKEQQSELDAIQRRISEVSARAKSDLRCGMTLTEVKRVMGKPKSTFIGTGSSCENQAFLNYGSFWAAFKEGILACLVPIDKLNLSICSTAYDSCKCN